MEFENLISTLDILDEEATKIVLSNILILFEFFKELHLPEKEKRELEIIYDFFWFHTKAKN